jgi:ferrous iron transport protein A
MTLVAAELLVGESGRVIRVVGANDVTRRLLEMGVTPGVEIRRLGAAPLGDPLEFELRGYRLSLRKSEAEQIEISDWVQDAGCRVQGKANKSDP